MDMFVALADLSRWCAPKWHGRRSQWYLWSSGGTAENDV